MCVRSTRGKTIQTRADYGDLDSTGRIKETHLLLITGLCLQGYRLHGTASSESLRECIYSIENILVEISYLSSKTLP